MAQATEVRGREGLMGGVGAPALSLRALWEDAWPERLATTVLPPTVAMLRFTMGWIFAYSGFDKLIRGFSASGYLANATQGPLTGWFHSLAANSTAVNVIDPLVVWGQILIGLSLVFGVFTRWGLFWGAVMVFMFYLSAFPPANNPFMDEHLVYILLFAILGALGAGRILGLDYFIERLPLVKRVPGVKFILG
jgi:thiosulfate dehydrogenase [quinone] large subunit